MGEKIDYRYRDVLFFNFKIVEIDDWWIKKQTSTYHFNFLSIFI